MLGGLIIILLTGFIAFGLVNMHSPVHSETNRLLKRLFVYHVLMAFVYYWYALLNPSDSKGYYNSALATVDWFSYYGTSTTFIKFIHFPLGAYLGFSYEASMFLFAFIGYLGFVYFYLAFRERIHFKHSFLSLNLMTLIFFLPNLHFWTASLGKGSVIFLGIGLFFYAVNSPRRRLLHLLSGSLLIYHVRPHIMLVMLVSYALALIFSTKGISVFWRFAFLALAGIAFVFIYQDVLGLVGIDEEEFLTQGLDLSRRARELSKATSGIDISGYNLPLQVFTFLYRPLFFDAPGVLGLIVSVENVIYLLITFKLLSSFKGWRFLLEADFIAKGALLSFLTVSIALAQISGNLGLAIRQKSQVIILFLFVVLAFLDSEKMKLWKAQKARAVRQNRTTAKMSMKTESSKTLDRRHKK
jgi:hypothetical protein